MNRYKELRDEFRRPTFRSEMFSKHGNRCFNCGSDLYVELHHVVPLFLGGTNRDTNIVPLCYQCHKKAHGGRNIQKSRTRPKNVGRPKRALPKEYKDVLWSYVNGDIGRKECENILGLAKSSKLSDCSFYKEFLSENAIKKHKNNIDLWNSDKYKDRDNTNKVSARIFYEDGREEVRYV